MLDKFRDVDDYLVDTFNDFRDRLKYKEFSDRYDAAHKRQQDRKPVMSQVNTMLVDEYRKRRIEVSWQAQKVLKKKAMEVVMISIQR